MLANHASTREQQTAPPQRPNASVERRAERRDPVIGSLWLIDSVSATILRCQCIDISRGGMRLRVPLGYGVQDGQEYELTSHLPGQSAPPGMGLMVNRRARVVRTEIVAGTRDMEYNVEVGVELKPGHASVFGDMPSVRTSA